MMQMNIADENLKIIFKYGSSVYKNITNCSDLDLIAIGDVDKILKLKCDNDLLIDLKILSFQSFLVFLEMHEISIIECVSLLLNDDTTMYKINDDKFRKIILSFYEDNLNLKKLRVSVSKKASNSFVKAKKKIILENEDSYIGLKSLFHSIRIFDFGIQIGKFGYIKNFKSCNDLWDKLILQKNYILSIKTEEEFEEFVIPWKKIFNEKHSEFKKIATK